ncbi:MAG: diguanylate cyclase [Hahellaceae bacterium]|nr:diguanylate cyclase [Hahellaceae bacterium]
MTYSTFRKSWHSPLNRKVLALVLGTSSLFAVIATLIQMAFAYVTEQESNVRQIENYVATSQAGIVRALWDIDVDVLREQLKGALKLEPIRGIEIIAVDGTALAEYESSKTNDATLKFPLQYEQQALGTLLIYVSYDAAGSKVISNFIFIVLMNFLKTLLVSLVLMYLLQIYLGRQLVVLAQVAETLSPDSLTQSDEPDAEAVPLDVRNRRDELGQIANALHILRQKLAVHLTEQRRYKQQLVAHRDELEARVQERTQILEQRSEIEQLLATVSSRLLRASPAHIKQVVEQCLATVAPMLKCERFVLSLFEADSHLVRYAAWQKASYMGAFTPEKVSPELMPWLFQELLQHRLVICISPEKLPEFAVAERDLMKTLNIKGAAVYPLFDEETLVGLLSCINREAPLEWSDESSMLLSRVGDLFNYALIRAQNWKDMHHLHQELSRANAKLQLLVDIDELTGVPNRRAFNQNLRAACRQVSRAGKALLLLLCDIDDFKRFNDTYGHLQGDEVLRTVATSCMQVFKRGGDFFARTGGEEFSGFFLNIEANDAQKIADRLCRTIAAMKIPHQSARAAPFVTLSIGAYWFVPAVDSTLTQQDMDRLLDEADKALYLAKEQGRNRAVVTFQHVAALRNDRTA